MSLWQMSLNASKTIEDYASSIPGPYLNRINDLGLKKGESVRLIRETPFGGPKVYQVGDSVFSLSKEIAEKIIVL